MALYPLFASVRSLSGVGPNLMASLRRLLGRDDPRVLDLLLQPPLGNRQLDALEDLSMMADGAKVSLSVRIGNHQPPPRQSKAPYKIQALLDDDRPIDLVFFHARGSYLNDQFPTDSVRLIHGRLGNYRNRWQMAHPEILPDDAHNRHRAGLVYALSEGLTQAKLKKLIEQALNCLPELEEWHDKDLPPFKMALAAVHGHSDQIAPEAARRRLALDELLASQIALQSARGALGQAQGRANNAEGRLRTALLESLPFAPTTARLKAFGDIQNDMRAARPMLRLLMGDVGSGKTLVALMAILDIVETGRQAALMAPTEVLARQHAQSLTALAKPLGIEIGLLTGSDPGKAREAVKARLARGELQVVVGTHALFQETVTFADLALAVIDEQHRFGVEQRMELVRKGEAVDLLLMTATPIPRSLVLAQYGDVDVSRLREKPPGRQPIQTAAVAGERLEEVIAAVQRAMQAKDRVYWVCPVIEEALEAETPTAEDRFAMLSERFGDAVCLVHGRLKPAEKAQAMESFAKGQTQLMVATTVIEVGVDVPEATVIVIDGAQHFGLAQLHQLRGRVGRGSKPSTALLLYEPPLSKTARQRLAIMRETDDGFRIAEEDLKLRGPGEILGSRQSGFASLRFANLSQDLALVDEAVTSARQLLAEDDRLSSPRGQAVRNLLQLFDLPLHQTRIDAG